MSLQAVYEGDTVRLRLNDLSHDFVGPIILAATVTYTVYRANLSVHGSGSMTYSPTLKAWQALVNMPALTSDELMTAIATVVAQGSTKNFELTIPVQALPV